MKKHYIFGFTTVLMPGQITPIPAIPSDNIQMNQAIIQEVEIDQALFESLSTYSSEAPLLILPRQ